MITIKHCPECGHTLPDPPFFCNWCGSCLNKTCLKCELIGFSKHCTQCGSEMVLPNVKSRYEPKISKNSESSHKQPQTPTDSSKTAKNQSTSSNEITIKVKVLKGNEMKEIRLENGGGTRHIAMNKQDTFNEVKNKIKDFYFCATNREKYTSLGSYDNYISSLLDFKKDDLAITGRFETLEKYLKDNGLKPIQGPSFYLHLLEKPKFQTYNPIAFNTKEISPVFIESNNLSRENNTKEKVPVPEKTKTNGEVAKRGDLAPNFLINSTQQPITSVCNTKEPTQAKKVIPEQQQSTKPIRTEPIDHFRPQQTNQSAYVHSFSKTNRNDPPVNGDLPEIHNTFLIKNNKSDQSTSLNSSSQISQSTNYKQSVPNKDKTPTKRPAPSTIDQPAISQTVLKKPESKINEINKKKTSPRAIIPSLGDKKAPKESSSDSDTNSSNSSTSSAVVSKKIVKRSNKEINNMKNGTNGTTPEKKQKITDQNEVIVMKTIKSEPFEEAKNTDLELLLTPNSPTSESFHENNFSSDVQFDRNNQSSNSYYISTKPHKYGTNNYQSTSYRGNSSHGRGYQNDHYNNRGSTSSRYYNKYNNKSSSNRYASSSSSRYYNKPGINRSDERSNEPRRHYD